MIEITMRIPLETRQYKIPVDIAEQAIDKFENVPIFYDNSQNNIPNNQIVGAVLSGKLDGDSIIVDGYLFKDASIDFFKFDSLHVPASIEICNPKKKMVKALFHERRQI